MKMSMQQIVLIAASTTTGLIAGLLYAYSCSVNPGLGKLSNEGYITAMQSINREIQNPLFFISFIGSLLLLPISAWLQYKSGDTVVFYFIFAAAIIYILGTFAVTMIGNVPLNNSLDKFNLKNATAEEIAKQRSLFEVQWNRLHSTRTVAAVVAFVLVIIAIVKRKG